VNNALMDRQHLSFLLDEVLQVGRLRDWEVFASQDRDDWLAVMDSAHHIALQWFAPHHRLGDVEEPHVRDGKVALPAQVEVALAAYASAGFNAASAPVEHGGMGLPYVIALACDGLFMTANIATSGYALLTRGAAHLLLAHGSSSQIRRFAEPLLEGRYFGTMCLSEPQAGSSLGDITTRATPQPDGSYRVEGCKMWISGGEHEMGENIIHLVLARVVGDAPGVRGLSLFVVPRYHVLDDGSIGGRNDVRLAGLNHKLGQRGIVNTFLKFGEQGDCVAELVGQRGAGLTAMFHMMNEARIGVGMGAAMSWARPCPAWRAIDMPCAMRESVVRAGHWISGIPHCRKCRSSNIPTSDAYCCVSVPWWRVHMRCACLRACRWTSRRIHPTMRHDDKRQHYSTS